MNGHAKMFQMTAAHKKFKWKQHIPGNARIMGSAKSFPSIQYSQKIICNILSNLDEKSLGIKIKKYKWDLALVNNIPALRPKQNIFGTNCQRQLVRVKDFWICNRQYYQIWDNPRIKLFTIVWNRQYYFWLKWVKGS